MYKNVGKELKFWARIAVVLLTILFALIGMITAGLLEAPGIIIICVMGSFAVIGYILGHFYAIKLYAYGELVDCVMQLNRKIKEQEDVPVQLKKKAEGTLEEVMPLSWYCGSCGYRNAPDAKFCTKCGSRTV